MIDIANFFPPFDPGRIYFTDLQGQFPNKAPDYPVLWSFLDLNGAPPFGEIVNIQ